MTKDGFERLAKAYVKKILSGLPATRNGSGRIIAHNRMDLFVDAMVKNFLNFKEIRERLSAKKIELVQILIDAEGRYPSKQDVLEALLAALDD